MSRDKAGNRVRSRSAAWPSNDDEAPGVGLIVGGVRPRKAECLLILTVDVRRMTLSIREYYLADGVPGGNPRYSNISCYL